MDGEFNIARWKVTGALLNQRVCKVVAKDNTDEEYLRFALSKALKKIEERTAFVTVKHLSAKELNKLEISVPSYNEQKEISTILKKLEGVIAYRQQELEKMNQLIKARFVEMFLGKGYGYKSVSEVTVSGTQNGFYKKGSDENGTIPTVKMSQLFEAESIDQASGFDYVYMSQDVLRKYRLTENDLLFGRRSLVPAGAGKCRRVGNLKGDMVFESSIIRITLNTDIILPRFMQSYIDSEEGDKAMNSLRSGTTVVGIKGSDLQNYLVMAPPLEQQKKYVAFTEQVDKSKSAVQKALDEAQLLFDSLMQKYFG